MPEALVNSKCPAAWHAGKLFSAQIDYQCSQAMSWILSELHMKRTRHDLVIFALALGCILSGSPLYAHT